MKIDIETKQRLKNLGRWEDFLEMREGLKDQGVPPSEAARLSLQEFLPEEGAGDYPPTLQTCIAEDDTQAEEDVDPVNFAASGGLLSMIPPLPERVADLRATETENIKWVSNHIMPGVSMDDCPSPAAWFEVFLCRLSQNYLMKTFMEKRILKLVPTRPEEKDDEKELDGTPTLEILMKIQAIGEERDGGDGTLEASYASDVGSNPTPAIEKEEKDA